MNKIRRTEVIYYILTEIKDNITSTKIYVCLILNDLKIIFETKCKDRDFCISINKYVILLRHILHINYI